MNISIPIPGLLETKEEGLQTEFTFGPYAPGFANTIGTCMRRCLLSSIPAAGITYIVVDGTMINNIHSVVPGMQEDLRIFVENLKNVSFKFTNPGVESATLSIKADTPGVITSAMISNDGAPVEVLNDEYLCTFTPSKLLKEFRCKIHIKVGKGYVYPSSYQNEQMPPNAIPITNFLNSVTKVALDIQQARYGDRTDYEVLKMTVKSIGISAADALDKAARILMEQMNIFLTGPDVLRHKNVVDNNKAELLEKNVKDLNLSEKTTASLEQHGIKTFGDLVNSTRKNLLSIPRLGGRKIKDIEDSLAVYGLFLLDGMIKENE